MKPLKNILHLFPFAYKLLGSDDIAFESFGNLSQNKDTDIIWVRTAVKEELEGIIASANSNIIICCDIEALQVPAGKTLVLVSHPQLFFLRLIKNLYANTGKSEICSTAVIHPKARIGKNVSIGHHAIIGDCSIGENTVIKANTVIHDHTEIGNNVLISEFCNIGGQGFGHIKNEHGTFENMLHIGKVVIEDEVEIFPYTNVDRATITETRICKGSKIDHYCHIGHNTYVGENTLIAAQVVLAGGSKILDNAFVGVNTIVKDSCVVGNRCFVGMGSIVTKNIPDGQTWTGAPARELSAFTQLQKKLNEL